MQATPYYWDSLYLTLGFFFLASKATRMMIIAVCRLKKSDDSETLPRSVLESTEKSKVRFCASCFILAVFTSRQLTLFHRGQCSKHYSYDPEQNRTRFSGARPVYRFSTLADRDGLDHLSKPTTANSKSSALMNSEAARYVLNTFRVE